jgi:DNA-cytosine methyltransferase
MKIGNVLSLFDGMSCGQIALNRSGIEYDNYYASEVDKYAIKVTQHNYPNTIQLGDVTKVDGNSLPKIDLLIGGPPCQGFSFAGKQLNFSDPRSKLFFEFVRLLKEVNPKCFLLENVKMKKEHQDVITEHLGVEPIEINSALVSAQNRKRLYWTNIPIVAIPNDKEIFLQDIVEDGGVLKGKSQTILSTLYKENAKSMVTRNKQGLIVLCGALRGRYIVDGKWQDGKIKTAGLTKQRIEVRYDGKTNALTTVQKDNNIVYEPDGRPYYEVDGIRFRKLTPTECERLQTIPDGYTDCVSDTQRYKMLGNGWTVSVVSHIFGYLK